MKTIDAQANQTKNLVDKFLSYQLTGLRKLGFNKKLNHFSYYHKAFSSDQYGNILINYIDTKGKQYRTGGNEYEIDSTFVPSFTPKERQKNKSYPYQRKRFKNPISDGFRYGTQKGAIPLPYFTALYQCFINPETRLFENVSFEKIVITEGEKKAWALCLMGIPAIGISGIHMAVKAVKGELKDKDGKVKTDKNGNPKIGTIDANLLPELETCLIEYEVKELIQLQDTDATQNAHHSKRAASFAASVKNLNFALTKANIKHTYIHSTTKEKGIDDLLISLPIAQRKKAIKQLVSDYDSAIFKHKSKYFQIYNVTEANIRAVQKLFYQSTIRQADASFEHSGYLSDLYDQNTGFRNSIEKNLRVLIQFGTGGGKTYFARLQAKRDFKKYSIPTILIAPLNAIVEQQGKKEIEAEVTTMERPTKKVIQKVEHTITTHEVTGKQFDVFGEKTDIIIEKENLIVTEIENIEFDKKAPLIEVKKIVKKTTPYFTASTALEQFAMVDKNTELMVCNYDCIEFLIKSLKNQGIEKYIIALDEQHELINSAGYRAKQAKAVSKAIEGAFKVYAYSATPFLPSFENFKYIKVTDPTKKAVRLTLHKTKSLYKGALSVCNRFIGKNPIMCLFNNKQELRTIAKYYENQGFRVGVIYSEDGLQDNKEYQHIIEEETFPPNIDILLCTSKIATGLNIYADKKMKLVYVENSEIDGKQGINERLLKQFYARIRNIENVIDCAVIVKNGRCGNSVAPSHYIYNKMLADYETQAQNYNVDTVTIGGSTAIYYKSNYADFINILDVNEDDTATPNKLVLAFLALKHEIKNTSIDDLFINEVGAVAELDKATNKEANNTKKATAKERKAIESLIYKEIAYDDNTARLAANKVANKTLDTGLKAAIKTTLGGYATTEVFEVNFYHEMFVKILSIILMKFCRLGLDFTTATNIIYQQATNADGTAKIDKEGNEQFYLKSSTKINTTFDLLNTFQLMNSSTGCLSKKEQYQRIKYQKLIEAVEALFEENEGKLSSSVLATTVRQKYNRSYTNSRAMKLVKTLFKVEYEKDKNNRTGFYKNLGRWNAEMIDNLDEKTGLKISDSIIKRKQRVKCKNRTENQHVTTPIINRNTSEKLNWIDQKQQSTTKQKKANMMASEMDILAGIIDA